MPLIQPPSSPPVPPLPRTPSLEGSLDVPAVAAPAPLGCGGWARWSRARVGCTPTAIPRDLSHLSGPGVLCAVEVILGVCMLSAMCHAQGSTSPRHGRLAQYWTGCQPAGRLLGAVRALQTHQSVQTCPHSGCYQDCDVRRAGICSLPMKVTMTSASSWCGLVHWPGRSSLRKWERSS